MATSFLTSTDITNLTGQMSNHFQTFTLDRSRTIIVYKEPKKVVSSRDSTVYPGYGPQSNLSNITSYVAVSGTYPAVINFVNQQKSEEILEPKVNVPKDAICRIKVEQNCADFINRDKTECIQVYSKKYNVISEMETNDFLGLKYYIYYLSETS
ncbi:MAG: hypothetical protein AABY22_24895 [Nanoarchaeota archaeon]